MAGRLPSELMPPVEHDLAASDFDDAVVLHLYLFERQRAVEDMKAQALMIASALRSDAGGDGGGASSEFFTPEAEDYLERSSGRDGVGFPLREI